jgi:hypothetical protein
LTLKICGRFNKSEVGLKMSGSRYQESEGIDTLAVCILGGQILILLLLEEHDCLLQNVIN